MTCTLFSLVVDTHFDGPLQYKEIYLTIVKKAYLTTLLNIIPSKCTNKIAFYVDGRMIIERLCAMEICNKADDRLNPHR